MNCLRNARYLWGGGGEMKISGLCGTIVGEGRGGRITAMGGGRWRRACGGFTKFSDKRRARAAAAAEGSAPGFFA